MKIPVLTYHSTNISGNEYHNNDHIALKSDLDEISKQGFNILSAHDLVRWIKSEINLDNKKKYVVLTFDDGVMLDYSDWNHPQFGFQRSFFNILKEYNGYIHATSFVIASPKDRKLLEKTCMGGHPIWHDDWWQKAEDSQLISIENHSWDHLHPTLKNVAQKQNLKGNFQYIDSFEDAEKQIKHASLYINSQLNSKKTQLFAYPCGEYNQYLIDDYFPQQQDEILAAFSCEPEHASKCSNVWKIPRYMCGLHWKNKKEFTKIIQN
ncbi:MAG: polysaccharide deacetylase family protein [Marinicellaceae bacterium]